MCVYFCAPNFDGFISEAFGVETGNKGVVGLMEFLPPAPLRKGEV
jgi:hypothetical protein